jgi:anti-anti-sigma regulatory factor
MTRSPYLWPPAISDRENFRFTCTRDGEQLTVRVLAKINALNVRPLRDRVLPEIADGAKWITIDMAGVESIEKRYFGELLSIAQHARGKGGAVTLLDARPDIITAIRQYGIAPAFTFAFRGSAFSHPQTEP